MRIEDLDHVAVRYVAVPRWLLIDLEYGKRGEPIDITQVERWEQGVTRRTLEEVQRRSTT